MSANENTTKICVINNDQSIRDAQEIGDEANNKAIVKYEEKDKAIICEKCTILKNLKDTITHIYHTTVKNVPDESDLYQNVRNFCELDIINNLYNSASQDNCVNCRKLKSETNVMSSHGRQKHKHKHMKRSESQIDNRSKNSSSTSGLQRKGSRTSRSLSRNAILYDNSVNPSDTSKEEVLKWKNEIETLEIKRQVFTAVGENKSKGFRSSRDKEKSSRKQQKKKADTNETNEFNAPPLNTNFTANKIILMNEDCLKIDDKFPKKDLEDLMKIKANRSTKKKRNNSPNLPIQPDLELVKKDLKEKMSPVPKDLINFINIDLKEKMSPKLIRLYGKESAKQRSVSKSKKKVDKEDANVHNIIQYNYKRNEKDFDKSCDKEIIDIFKQDNTVIDEVVTNKVKTKHKDKEEHKIRKHRKKEQTEKCEDNICSRHSNSSKKIVDNVKIDEELNKAIITPNTLLLFGVDYLINSQALQKEAEESSENGSCVILNANREELPLKDRKEMSISNLNLSPIIDHYARNKPIIDSIFYQAHKKRHQPKHSRKSDDLSIISDAVTSKEKSIRRHRQDRARHYFGSQAKCTRLINQTTNHMVSDENLIEVSTKTLANDIIKSSVEGIEPPRRIVNKAFHRKSNITALKHNRFLHMTFLEPVAFPAEFETLPPQAPSAEDHNLSEGNKVEVVQAKVGKEVLPLKHCPSRERKSKISVLYEHRSNSARRKELRNKICNHQRSKQNFVKSRGKSDERRQSVQKVCTNPDLVRRVSFARNSIKSKQKCSKCQGTKRAEKNDKIISANISGVPNEFVNKNKKLSEKKSSKKMCSVDTQTDLLDYKSIATTDHISQTTEVKNANKRSSPIMIGVPGVHKSDTNVARKEYIAAPNKSKPSAYQKLQSVVLSLFENAKDTYDEEIDGISKKNDSNINSKLPNNSTTEENDTKTVKNASITPPGPPNSPITPKSAIKMDLFTARIKSGIPKPTKKSLDESRDSSLSDSKPKDGNLSKSVLGRDKQQNDGASNSLDLNVLKDCIEDLITVLNGIKEKPPKDLVLKNHHARKANELPEDVGPDEVKRLISSDTVDTSEKLVKKKRLDKRPALNVLSSTSADSNRDSNLSCKRKSQRRKSKKLSRHQLIDEPTLKRVFKNKNCHGSDSLTQFSSSGNEFRNVIKEKGAVKDELETLKEFFYKNNVTNHNDNEFTKRLGVGTLLVDESTNVKNDLHPELLRNLPKPKTDITTLQKAEGSSIDYNHVMEQLVYMFTQKPPPKNDGIVNAGNQTSSSNFSADSLEQSYKYEPANSRNMPPKNCNFFVYTSTIELDKDMKKNLAENNNLRSFASFKNQSKLNSYSNISNTTSKSSYTVSSTSSGYGTGKKSASLKNFFKKGSSLLDLFKHKQSNALTSNQEVTSKCGIISEMSSENSDATENKLIADFSPAQYWFTICPQKENSLETVHEGVQASPETKEKTTMRKWADTVTNQSIQTKTPCQSDHSCKPQSCDIEKCVKEISVLTSKKEFSKDKHCCPPGGRCLATLENVFNEAELNKHKHKTYCKCKREPEYFNKPTTKEPLPSEVADFILNTLLDNVMNAIQVKKEAQHTEREVEPSKPQRSNSPISFGAVNQKDGLKSKNEDKISSRVRSSDTTSAAKKLVRDASDSNSVEKSMGIINTKPIDGELEEKARNKTVHKIEPIDDALEKNVEKEKVPKIEQIHDELEENVRIGKKFIKIESIDDALEDKVRNEKVPKIKPIDDGLGENVRNEKVPKIKPIDEELEKKVREEKVPKIEPIRDELEENVRNEKVPKIKPIGDELGENVRNEKDPKIKPIDEELEKKVREEKVPKIEPIHDELEKNVRNEKDPKIKPIDEELEKKVREEKVPKIEPIHDELEENVRNEKVPKIKPIGDELGENVKNEKVPKIKPIDDELEEKVLNEKLQEIFKSAEAQNIEEVSLENRSMEILKPEETISRKSSNKNKSAQHIETGREKTSLKLNDDKYLKATVTVVRSLSNKENFEKMLKAYEKEDNFAERLSMDDVFFEKEIATLKSNNALVESVKSVPSEEFIPTKILPLESVLITNGKKKRDKKKKFQQFFRKNKHSVKDIMAPVEDDGNSKQIKGSLYQIPQDVPKRLPVVPPAIPKNRPSKTKDMRFEEEEKVHGLPLIYKKKTDCAPVELEDIGTCFARGFRPDNLSLSGDACFNFNKQDKYVLSPNMTNTGETIIDFSERQTPLDYLLALGFMVDEASNALKDEDIRSRLLAAITEARVWINKITTTQGTLLYLVSYKTHPKTMRYFLQLVEAIINNRINNAVKLNGFLKILERVEDGELQMINLLGADKFEDEENEEKIVKKQLRQLFTTVYRIAELEAKRTDNILTKESYILLRVLAAKYRAGLHPHLELIAGYIGQNLIKTEIQLEAAMIYLSRLDTADVKLKEFEAYCAIHCDKEDEENEH